MLLPDGHLEWSVHLARRVPRRTAVALALIALAAAAAGVGFQSVIAGILAAVVLVAAIADYLFPVHYRLSAHGVEARGLWHRRRMTWPQVRRVLRDDLGVKLSPLPRSSRLEAYRGIYLWFADNADQVMATIEHYTAEAAGGDIRPPV